MQLACTSGHKQRASPPFLLDLETLFGVPAGGWLSGVLEPQRGLRMAVKPRAYPSTVRGKKGGKGGSPRPLAFPPQRPPLKGAGKALGGSSPPLASSRGPLVPPTSLLPRGTHSPMGGRCLWGVTWSVQAVRSIRKGGGSGAGVSFAGSPACPPGRLLITKVPQLLTHLLIRRRATVTHLLAPNSGRRVGGGVPRMVPGGIHQQALRSVAS
jgi:hypothetical protein